MVQCVPIDDTLAFKRPLLHTVFELERATIKHITDVNGIKIDIDTLIQKKTYFWTQQTLILVGFTMRNRFVSPAWGDNLIS